MLYKEKVKFLDLRSIPVFKQYTCDKGFDLISYDISETVVKNNKSKYHLIYRTHKLVLTNIKFYII
jgi:hypothetical protein